MIKDRRQGNHSRSQEKWVFTEHPPGNAGGVEQKFALPPGSGPCLAYCLANIPGPEPLVIALASLPKCSGNSLPPISPTTPVHTPPAPSPLCSLLSALLVLPSPPETFRGFPRHPTKGPGLRWGPPSPRAPAPADTSSLALPLPLSGLQPLRSAFGFLNVPSAPVLPVGLWQGFSTFRERV